MADGWKVRLIGSLADDSFTFTVFLGLDAKWSSLDPYNTFPKGGKIVISALMGGGSGTLLLNGYEQDEKNPSANGVARLDGYKFYDHNVGEIKTGTKGFGSWLHLFDAETTKYLKKTFNFEVMASP